MGSLFRSEEMTLCQLFIQSEAAYNCVSELGELGLLQFRDLNSDVNAFQRKFVNEIRRCDEMERHIGTLEEEIKKEGLAIPNLTDEMFFAPGLREESELEVHLEKLEREMLEINQSTVDMKKRTLELVEMNHILQKNEQFYSENMTTSSSQELRRLSQATITNEAKSFLREVGPSEQKDSVFSDLETVTGVITRDRLMAFETMLWRISRGNVFVRHEDIEEKLEDPMTGEKVSKLVFFIFFQGEHLKTKVNKICEGFRARLYPCPYNDANRKDMIKNIASQLEEMNTVYRETSELKRRVLADAAKNLPGWLVKVKKMTAVYHSLNMFNLHVTHNMLIGEAWCAVSDLDKAQAALNKATEASGGSVSSIINRMATKETCPTFNRTNKFTEGFQAIVDAYGVATYREINPAPYTIITFPFLFSLMFGDTGHGLLMAIFGAFLVIREKSLKSAAAGSEIFGMFFAGRYIILLMGIFSIYAGMIYNDIFSKAINIFGSSWKAEERQGALSAHHINMDPSQSYVGVPYTFGLDPVWMVAENKILFFNSYKMKLSVIMGVIQMLSGVFLSCLNHSYFKNKLNIFCEFIPQVIFLMAIFGYMDAIILYKWVHFTSETSSCAPSILITLINMFMVKYVDEPCNLAPMYEGQKTIQVILVLVALVCVPWMLIIKPCIISRRRKAKKNFTVRFHTSSRRNSTVPHHHGDDELHSNDEVFVDIVSDPKSPIARKEPEEVADKHEESMGDVIIHQAIHTIEYCLGSISHTASYLRLWALSLAHAQLSEVLWNMVMRIGLNMKGIQGGFVMFVIFAAWACLTVAILLLMEGLSAFLHALRLHWVEFQSKFYYGAGFPFQPFSFRTVLEPKDE